MSTSFILYDYFIFREEPGGNNLPSLKCHRRLIFVAALSVQEICIVTTSALFLNEAAATATAGDDDAHSRFTETKRCILTGYWMQRRVAKVQWSHFRLRLWHLPSKAGTSTGNTDRSAKKKQTKLEIFHTAQCLAI